MRRRILARGGNKYALEFDAAKEQYVEVKRGAFDDLQYGTITGRFKRNSFDARHAIFGSQDGGDKIGYLLWLMILDTGLIEIRIREGASNTDHLLARSSTAITDSVWHHFAFTVGPDGNAFFLDGNKETLTYNGGDASTVSFFDNIGGDPLHNFLGTRMYAGSVGLFFNGLQDDLRIYCRALSADEIGVLSTGGNVSRKGLVLDMNFDQKILGAGLRANDLSGYENHGDLLPIADPPQFVEDTPY